MDKSLLKIIRYVVFLAFGILLLYFAFRKVNFSEMISILKGAKYSWVILSLFISILAFISRAMRWVLLVEPLGFKPGLWNTLNAVLFGYLANYALPRMGEISKCIALNRKEKVPVDALIGTVVVERAVDLLSLLVIMFALLILRFEKFGSFFRDQVFNNLSEKTNSILSGNIVLWIVIGGLFMLAVFLAFLFRDWLKQHKLTNRFINAVKNLLEGFRSLSRMKKKWAFLLHTFFIWTCYAMMTWVVVFALPDITGHLTFADGLFLLVIGSLGMAAPVQAGIGAFQWIVSNGLAAIYGLTLTEGQSFASLQYFSQTLLVIVLGSLATLFLYTRLGNGSRVASAITEQSDEKSQQDSIPE